MTSLLLALALAVGTQRGSLYVHVVTPGLQILMDGVPVATSSADEGGAVIHHVAVGQHHVVIRADDGREAAFNVSIGPEQQTEITVSPLGFRKLNRAPDSDESSVLRVTSIPVDALVEFNGVTRQNHDATELAFENVPAGTYALVVTQSGKAVRTRVDLPKGSVVTVDLNFKTLTAQVTDTRVRPRRLQLYEPNDALRRLGIPSHWKTAIRAALPSTVSIVDAWAGGNTVKVRLKVPSDRMVAPLLESLTRASGFSRVAYGSSPQRDQGAWIVDFIFYFAT